MIKIYKDGDTFYIITDAKTAQHFLTELPVIITHVAETYDNDIQFQMDCMIPLCYEMLLILDNYKPRKKEPYHSVGQMTPHSKLIYETDKLAE